MFVTSEKKINILKNKDCLLYRFVKSCFHLAAILNSAVSWCEAWNPQLGCSADPIASRSEISGSKDSWLHTSHQLSQVTDKFKTNMNIIFKSDVRALPGLSVSPRVFQRPQICDTHASVPSPDHLCQPEAHRFWKHKILLFHLLCI